MQTYEKLADKLHGAGPLSPRERRLVKLAIGAGAEAEGAVRLHTRKALGEGIEPEGLRHVAVLAVSTAGYPAAIAAYGLDERRDRLRDMTPWAWP